MADITMCLNNDCKARSYCYRQTASPSQGRQSMAEFKPKNNEIGESFECDNFWSNRSAATGEIKD